VLRYPAFAPETGKYKCGATQTRIPGSVACQVHYPTSISTESSSATTRRYPYFRPQAVEGLADYSRTPVALLQMLSARQHPCLMDAEPLTIQNVDNNNNNNNNNDTPTKYPIVLFSHGLGGSMEMYTQLCQQIASHGYIVIAMEHEDGSGAYADTILGETVRYKRPDDSPYSRQKVLGFRRPFLQQRVDEVSKLVHSIVHCQDEASPQLQAILKVADFSKGIALLGHSFGGATMILAAQEYQKRRQSASSSSTEQTGQQPPFINFNSLSLFDPWAFSLDDETLNLGIKSSVPTLSILSESWVYTNPEVQQVDDFHEQCQNLKAWYMPNSVHTSFADSVSWLPGFVARKLYLRGKKERRFQTIPAVAKACAQHIQSSLGQTPDTIVVWTHHF
jgi:platelet-activating factor acetylhydrolase